MAVQTEIIPYIFYRDVAAAMAWLAAAFGFTPVMRTGTPSGGVHGEMALDGQRIMLGEPASSGSLPVVDESGPVSQGVFVYLDDVDAHFQRALAAGARIDQALQDVSYGRYYSARDLEGHMWYFTTPPQKG
jgi:PhnB protein